MNIHSNRLIVKIGTANLVNGGTSPDVAIAEDVALQIAQLWEQGISTVLVTSGAVAMGKAHCIAHDHDPAQFAKSRLASIGAWKLLSLWGVVFARHNLLIGQAWITYASWRTTGERSNLIDGIDEMLRLRTVPIVNENDLLAMEELRAMGRGISDNDWLASKLALLIRAGAVLFLSDTDGLYEGDPKTDKAVRRYKVIDARRIPEHFKQGSAGAVGRGGVRSKVFAGARCAKVGMKTSVATFRKGENTILRFVQGEDVGTRIGTRNVFY